MPYMVDPGARLMVGPHGTLEESLGACCAPCAGKSGLGAVSTPIPIIAQSSNTGIVPPGVLTAPPANAQAPTRDLRPLLIAGGVAAAATLFYFSRRKKR